MYRLYPTSLAAAKLLGWQIAVLRPSLSARPEHCYLPAKQTRHMNALTCNPLAYKLVRLNNTFTPNIWFSGLFLMRLISELNCMPLIDVIPPCVVCTL